MKPRTWNIEPRTLSIVITSYTMERFKDICELLDSIKSQTLLKQSQAVSTNLHGSQSNLNESQSNLKKSQKISMSLNESQPVSPIEVIFVAERSRELCEKVRN